MSDEGDTWLIRTLTRWLRIPPEPAPPAGSPGSLRVFRAARNYLRLRQLGWAAAQAGALVGVLASIIFIREVELQRELDREFEAQQPPPISVQNEAATEEEKAALREAAEAAAREQDARREREAQTRRGPFHQFLHDRAPWWLQDIPRRIPASVLGWIKLAEAIGLAGFAVQLIWSFLLVRIDYLMRWYMVTDRSLRLRWGVLQIHAATMSFANLQQVMVRQGPLQRLLGIADVEVRSAGGGSGANNQPGAGGDSMHRARFHGVDNAKEIRDLILARLRQFQEAGLGDPDDTARETPPGSASETLAPRETVEAARALLAEVKAWRAELSPRSDRHRT